MPARAPSAEARTIMDSPAAPAPKGPPAAPKRSLPPTWALAPLASLTDQELLAAHRGGRAGTDAELDRRYRPRLVAYARRLLRDEGEAEDVAQETLWRCAAVMGTTTKPIRVGAYLFQAARNGVTDRLRPQAPVLVDDLDRLALSDAHSDPAEVVDRRQRVRHLLAAVNALPHRQRRALLAVACEGRTHAEVAAWLDIDPAGSKALVHRARTTLRAAA